MIETKSKEDKKLLIGLQEGDSAVILKIYDLALPLVINWVQKNNGSEDDARDIFQEALLAVYKKVASNNLTLTCTLQSYLRIICKNLWLARLKRKDMQLNDPLDEKLQILENEHFEFDIENNEKTRLYVKHFFKLGDQCQEILSLYFKKTPLKVIAEKLDTTENYIKKRKFICKERLVKSIQQDPIFSEL
ncbi:MAG: sigma-70 family RNA polymerase sigma factor [Bacteroidota bacterium]